MDNLKKIDPQKYLKIAQLIWNTQSNPFDLTLLISLNFFQFNFNLKLTKTQT